MFEDLTQKLESVFKKLRGYGKITETNISDSMREVRRALLDADVNYKVVKHFIEDVQKRAIGQEVISSLHPSQLIIKIINDELIRLLGESRQDIKFSTLPPTVIMVAGLQGSGKTTFCAKLANHLKAKGNYPLLTAADIYRPAAVDQLIMLGKQIDVPVYYEPAKLPVELAFNSVNFSRLNARDVVIIDTAGRMHINEEMMREVESIKHRVSPNEILFVVDAMTGQDAVNTSKAFNEKLDFDGVVLTKLDGDTRGGAALSIRSIVNKPIKFISVGEKLDALEPFYPDRMASRILGMGDIVTFVEKAHEQFDEEKVKKLEAKLKKSQFTFEDFLEQLQQVKKMGPLSQLLNMIPGLNKLPANAEIDDKSLIKVEAIIQSMTQHERKNPNLLNGNRRKRIARGSGTSIQDVNKVLKQFYEMQKMMKLFARGKIPKNLLGMKLTAK